MIMTLNTEQAPNQEQSQSTVAPPISAPATIMLNQGRNGEAYRIVVCDIDARTRSKLETLGLVCNGRLTVISNTKSGLILDVRRSRLAIGNDLAKHIEVQPMSSEEDD